MFENTKDKEQESNAGYRMVAMLFALSGIAPVTLLLLDIVGAEQLLWVYLAVFSTVLCCNFLLRKPGKRTLQHSG